MVDRAGMEAAVRRRSVNCAGVAPAVEARRPLWRQIINCAKMAPAQLTRRPLCWQGVFMSRACPRPVVDGGIALVAKLTRVRMASCSCLPPQGSTPSPPRGEGSSESGNPPMERSEVKRHGEALQAERHAVASASSGPAVMWAESVALAQLALAARCRPLLVGSWACWDNLFLNGAYSRPF